MNTILFDLDGTLTDSGSGIINSVKYALKKAGREIFTELKKQIPRNCTSLSDRHYRKALKNFMAFPIRKRMMRYKNTGSGTIRPVFLSVSYIRVWRSVSVH